MADLQPKIRISNHPMMPRFVNVPLLDCWSVTGIATLADDSTKATGAVSHSSPGSREVCLIRLAMWGTESSYVTGLKPTVLYVTNVPTRQFSPD